MFTRAVHSVFLQRDDSDRVEVSMVLVGETLCNFFF